MRCVFSPDAQADIDRIWEATLDKWGVDQAENYMRVLQSATLTMGENPEVGRDCSEIRERYRKYPVGSHVMFYKIGIDKIDIVRILHQHMDFDRHL